MDHNRSKETCLQCSKRDPEQKAAPFFLIVATFTAWIGIQCLQNVHNTNIIPNSQTAQMSHAFKAMWARIF